MLEVRTQTTAMLDDKGRLMLPSSLRAALDVFRVNRLVLHCHQGAVWGWTPDTFKEKVEDRYKDVDPFDTTNLSFVHAVLSYNDEVDVDRAGRIRIPPDLREQAGLTKEVKVFSVMDRIEIWDVDRWKARFEQAQEQLRAPRPVVA